MSKELIFYSADDSHIYIHLQAAHLACVSIEFLLLCEEEGLIQARVTEQGLRGYPMEEIRRLRLIRRLHEDLDLSMAAIDVILHMREKILSLMDENERLRINDQHGPSR